MARKLTIFPTHYFGETISVITSHMTNMIVSKADASDHILIRIRMLLPLTSILIGVSKQGTRNINTMIRQALVNIPGV